MSRNSFYLAILSSKLVLPNPSTRRSIAVEGDIGIACDTHKQTEKIYEKNQQDAHFFLITYFSSIILDIFRINNYLLETC